MSTLSRFWPFKRNSDKADVPESDSGASEPSASKTAEVKLELNFAPNDPLLVYLQPATGPVDIAALALDSAALRECCRIRITKWDARIVTFG